MRRTDQKKKERNEKKAEKKEMEKRRESTVSVALGSHTFPAVLKWASCVLLLVGGGCVPCVWSSTAHPKFLYKRIFVCTKKSSVKELSNPHSHTNEYIWHLFPFPFECFEFLFYSSSSSVGINHSTY